MSRAVAASLILGSLLVAWIFFAWWRGETGAASSGRIGEMNRVSGDRTGQTSESSEGRPSREVRFSRDELTENGNEAAPAPVNVPSNDEADVGPRTFWGRVLARADRLPVVHAAVSLEGARTRSSDWEFPHDELFTKNFLCETLGGRSIPRFTTETDGEGYFSIAVDAKADPHSLFVCVEADGYATKRAAVTEEIRSRSHAKPILLRRSATLIVEALESSRRPAQAISVRVTSEELDPLFSESLKWQVRSDSSGISRFENLPAEVHLTVLAGRGLKPLYHSPKPLSLAPGERRWLTCTLAGDPPRGGHRLVGKVVDQLDQPVVDQVVWLLNQDAIGPRSGDFLLSGFLDDQVVSQASTGHRGEFEMDGIQQGSYFLGAAPPESLSVERKTQESELKDRVSSNARAVRVPEDSAQPVILRVWGGLFIHGEVRRADARLRDSWSGRWRPGIHPSTRRVRASWTPPEESRSSTWAHSFPARTNWQPCETATIQALSCKKRSWRKREMLESSFSCPR